MIAFLHTLSANVDKFDNIVKKYAPDAEIKHVVKEALLHDALANGVADYKSFNEEVEKIKSLEPEMIICTCSSYGEASDRRDDVMRIDRPIVEYILSKYSKIGLAYAASSTRDISADLLRNTAKAMGKKLKVVDIDASDAWPFYLESKFEDYVKRIAEHITEYTDQVEVVFLAQASMETAKEYVKDSSIEILSSPDYGVKKLLSQH